jgi:hypothetical protein
MTLFGAFMGAEAPSAQAHQIPSQTTQKDCRFWEHVFDIKQVSLYKGRLCLQLRTHPNWPNPWWTPGVNVRYNGLGYQWHTKELNRWWVDLEIYSFIDGRKIFHSQGVQQPYRQWHYTGMRRVDVFLSIGDTVCATLYRLPNQTGAGVPPAQVIRSCHTISPVDTQNPIR